MQSDAYAFKNLLCAMKLKEHINFQLELKVFSPMQNKPT